MEEAIKDLQDNIQSFQMVQQSILDRLQSIENSGCKPKSNAGSSNDSDDQSGGLKTHYGVKSLQQAVASHSPANKGAAAANSQADSVDRVDSSVQDEYQGIKDKVASIKIPQELRCGTSKAGIRREDSNAANIIANCAKYVETTIKLLWTLDDEPTQEELIEVFQIQKAHIDYLRQEHSALLVSSQFGGKTSQLFKNLSRGTTNLDEKQLDTLLKAVQITSNDSNSRLKPRDHFRGRGSNFGSYNSGYGSRYRSGYQRGGNHGHSGNNFNSSSNTYNHNGIATTSE